MTPGQELNCTHYVVCATRVPPSPHIRHLSDAYSHTIITIISPHHLLYVIILLQDGEGDSSTFQRGQTDVGGLCADHILTGQSPVKLHLVNQSRRDQQWKCGIFTLLATAFMD